MTVQPKQFSRIVVVPSESMAAYESAGYGDRVWNRYNAGGLFRDVVVASPLEKGSRNDYGVTIRGVDGDGFQRLLRDWRPDVVRGFGGYWAADFVCRYTGFDIPVVVSVHDPSPKLIHPSVTYADMVMCTSSRVEKAVIEMGCDPGRVRIVPNYIDKNVFRPVTHSAAIQRVSAQFPPGRYILHIGRKAEEKNLDTVIRALTFLPENYRCVFVGKGKSERYRELACEMGVDSRCYWIEAVPNSELPAWYSWCDCLCVPSRWEGFGIVFIEAAACGTPIVTSDIAPMNEYLRNGESACLVKDYESPQALATAVQAVSEDLPCRQILSSGAQQVALRFGRDVVQHLEAAFYKELLESFTHSLKWRWRRRLWSMKIAITDRVGAVRL